jgi:hypothetical protein
VRSRTPGTSILLRIIEAAERPLRTLARTVGVEAETAFGDGAGTIDALA